MDDIFGKRSGNFFGYKTFQIKTLNYFDNYKAKTDLTKIEININININEKTCILIIRV